ncbi:hypothetical protein [Dyadobacter psychrotolerans]|uniref:Uncharacterized protein n=1 Tax=Dyadobacter psychrotolerans TaxID=2541721 RepID=A0A4R5E0M5_9BACT|nr:hypothetical protein [Dyadobacter psychrotolerans]TDE18091.1 hypothetical protein E0F88_00630 [Dyadobacter psychrotolerans]
MRYLAAKIGSGDGEKAVVNNVSARLPISGFPKFLILLDKLYSQKHTLPLIALISQDKMISA